MKHSKTKSAMLMSLLSLLLCVAMLLGTTFAWFTDSASSGVNKIQSGNLDITVEAAQQPASGTTLTWGTFEGSTTLFPTSTVWEPGHAEVIYLKVHNAGTLALNYQVNVSPVSENGGVNVYGNSFKLSDYLQFGTAVLTSENAYASRDAAVSAMSMTTGLTQSITNNSAVLQSGNDSYMALVVYMPTTVGNEANYKTGTTAPEIELGITVIAKQVSAEADSFNNEYDTNAQYNPAEETLTYNYFPQVNVAGQVKVATGNSVNKGTDAGANVNVSSNTVTVASDTTSTPAATVAVAVQPVSGATEGDTGTVTLTVKKTGSSNFTVSVPETAEVTTYDVNTEVTGKVEPVANALYTVNLTIGAGKQNVEMYHGNNKMTKVDGTPTAADTFAYNATTGVVTMVVSHFSEFSVIYDEPVAAVGTKAYYSVADAIANVEADGVISLLTNVTLAEKLIINNGKAFTLNLNGKTLTGRTNIQSGNVTIENGTVAGGAQQALNVYGAETETENQSVLTIAKDVTVTADNFGVCMFGNTAKSNGYGAVVNIYGTVSTTGTGSEGAVFVSGNLGTTGATETATSSNIINIYGSVTSTTDTALALNGLAVVNVYDGAVLTGNTAATVKRGTLNVTGGTFTANGAKNEPGTDNYSGTEMTGAAVSVTDTYNQYGPLAVNISGGTFTSENGTALFVENGSYTTGKTITVTGGTFSTDPSAYVADTHEAKQSGSVWTVSPLDLWTNYAAASYATPVDTQNMVVTIASAEEFALFAKEVNANNAYAGYTVNLTADVDLDDHTWVPVMLGNDNNKGLVFDGNNHTVKNVKVKGNEFVGLFGAATCSTIKNLTVDGATIVGHHYGAAIAGHGLCGHFINCTVKNATIKLSTDSTPDNGDKAGAICGYLSGESTSEVTNCTVQNCTITGYRDIGGAVGYANGTATVTGNTVTNVTVNCDKTVNYKNYVEANEFDIHEVVGEANPNATVSNNTTTNVTVNN